MFHKAISYLLSVLHYLFFGLCLLVFHPIQYLCLKLGGYHAQKVSVDWLNFFLTNSLLLMGTTTRFTFSEKLPTDRSLIFVANHQSLYDIPAMIWWFRKHHPKFVAKKELGKGIPSVSFNLRHGGAALIDRKNPEQALSELTRFSNYLSKNQRSAVIFPEGTRSRDGVPKRFAYGGFKTILNGVPNALVVPVSINNSWRVFKYGSFPLSAFERITFYVHPPIEAKDYDFEFLFNTVEAQVKSKITVS
jgi:1-acyl-sn-glycerol-3-phosphate acyltransferase